MTVLSPVKFIKKCEAISNVPERERASPAVKNDFPAEELIIKGPNTFFGAKTRVIYTGREWGDIGEFHFLAAGVHPPAG